MQYDRKKYLLSERDRQHDEAIRQRYDILKPLADKLQTVRDEMGELTKELTRADKAGEWWADNPKRIKLVDRISFCEYQYRLALDAKRESKTIEENEHRAFGLPWLRPDDLALNRRNYAMIEQLSAGIADLESKIIEPCEKFDPEVKTRTLTSKEMVMGIMEFAR